MTAAAAQPPLPALPRSPGLVPGARTARRDAGRLEIALGRRRVVVADSPAVRQALRALREHRAPDAVDQPQVHALLADLVAADLIVDADLAHRSPAHASLAARTGLGLEECLRRRDGVAVAVHDAVSDGVLAVRAHAALRQAGLWSVDLDDPGTRTEDGAAIAVTLLLLPDVAAAGLAGPWMAAGAAHLPLVLSPDSCLLGPFVDPGLTACLQCVESHRGDADPAHALVSAQHAADAGTVLPDPALVAWALAAAAVDLVRAVEGDLPATWSRTRRLALDPTPEDADPLAEQPAQERVWWRHPSCGCAWQAVG